MITNLRMELFEALVEALLGDDITRLAAGPAHVAAVSGDGELFTWGESGGVYTI